MKQNVKESKDSSELIHLIELLITELESDKFPAAYYVYQNLYDLKNEIVSANIPNSDTTVYKLVPIISDIIYELQRLKENAIKLPSAKLICLFKEITPIILQYRSSLYSSSKIALKKGKKDSFLQRIKLHIQPKEKSKLERLSYIATIIGAIATVIGLIISYCL